MNGFRGVRRLISVRITNRILTLGGIVLLTRLIESSTVGQYFLYQGVVVVASILINIGTARAVEQRISASPESDRETISKFISAGITIQAVVWVIVAIVMVSLSPFVVEYLGAPLTLWVIVGMGLYTGGMLVKGILRATDRVSESATIELSFRIAWVVITMVLILFFSEYLQNHIMAPVFGFLSGLLVQLLFGLVKIGITPVIPNRQTIQSIISFGLFEFLTNIGGLSYSKGDVLILGLFVAPSAVAAYEIAWRISRVVMLPIAAVTSAVFPKLTELYSRDNYDQFAEYLSRMLAIASIFAIPALFGVTIIAGDLLGTVFSSEYVIATIPLIVLVGETVPESYQSMFVNSLKAINRPDLDAVTSIATAILNIIFNVFLAIEFGILGAAMATATVSTLGTTMNYLFLRWYVPIEFPFKIMAASVLAAALMAVGVTFVHSALEVSLLTVLFSVGVGLLIYTALVVLIEPMRECLRPLVTDFE